MRLIDMKHKLNVIIGAALLVIAGLLADFGLPSTGMALFVAGLMLIILG